MVLKLSQKNKENIKLQIYSLILHTLLSLKKLKGTAINDFFHYSD